MRKMVSQRTRQHQEELVAVFHQTDPEGGCAWHVAAHSKVTS